MSENNLSEIKVRTRWGEMDQNGHMRNVAYLDLSANCRMEFFDANGYTLMDFFGAGFGPIVLKDEIEYRAKPCTEEIHQRVSIGIKEFHSTICR